MTRGHRGPTVKFTEDAKNELDALGLHGGARQRAENWHRQQVAQQIPFYGPQSATITHLAHVRGSNDHQLHITVKQDGEKKRQHVYVNKRNMNQDYKNAVLSQYGSL